MTPDDVAEALARLETAPGAPTDGLEGGLPVTDVAAVVTWVRETGLGRGAYRSPSSTTLSGMLTAHAQARGWPFDRVPPSRLGALLKRLGFVKWASASKSGVRVDKASAARLWAAVPADSRERQRVKRKLTAKRNRAGRVDAPLFWRMYSGRRRNCAMPLVDSLGRVWPSARVAASLLPRACRAPIQLAAKKGSSASGVLWRYLLPDEVALIPADARCGQRMEWLAWGGPTRCPACGHGLRPGLPPPGGFPTPSPLESQAGGPTHTPSCFSPPQESSCTATVPK